MPNKDSETPDKFQKAARLLLNNPSMLETVLVKLLTTLYWSEDISFDPRGHAYDSSCGDYLDSDVEWVNEDLED